MTPGHGSRGRGLLRLRYIPPAIVMGCCRTPGSCGLPCSLPLAPCLLTCLAPGAARSFCPLASTRPRGSFSVGERMRAGEEPLGLVPWQAPPLRNAIELFGGMKRLPVQPLGSPGALQPLRSPCCWRDQSIRLSWSCRNALPSSIAESLLTSSFSKSLFGRPLCAGA